MSNDTIEAAVAEATGEDIETIRELGFYLIIRIGSTPARGRDVDSDQGRSAANRANRSRMRGMRR